MTSVGPLLVLLGLALWLAGSARPRGLARGVLLGLGATAVGWGLVLVVLTFPGGDG